MISRLLALFVTFSMVAQTSTSTATSNAAPTAEAATRAAIARVRAVDPKIHAVIALDPTALEQARAIGRSIGLELGEGSTGGGSDGNFTAALGVPTLYGLGIRGAGAHAAHEQIDIDSFAERTALLALLLVHL